MDVPRLPPRGGAGMTFRARSRHTPALSSEIFGFNDSPQAWSGEWGRVGWEFGGGERE